MLDRYGLVDHADSSVHTLSGGQRQLLALAGVLATEPAIVVADEPTTLLDLANTRRVGDALFALEQQLVLVTHDLDLARRCDRVLVIADAGVRFDGPADAAVDHYLSTVALVSSPYLVGVYQPGSSLLHRLPVGVKLGALAVFSIVVVVVRSAPYAFVFLAVAVLAALVARTDLRLVARSLRSVLLFAAIFAALQWLLYGPAKATETLVDLVTLALAAVVVSATTPVNAMLDAFIRWIGPLRHVGVDPERVALTIGLAIQALPGTIALAVETRDAARARGLSRHPRAYLTPFVIRVVARAHETGDALHARGIGDD